MVDNERKMILMVGLPASGKSSVARLLNMTYKDSVVLSFDSFKKEVPDSKNIFASLLTGWKSA